MKVTLQINIQTNINRMVDNISAIFVERAYQKNCYSDGNQLCTICGRFVFVFI